MQLDGGKGEWNSDTPGKKQNFWSQPHAILIKMAQNVFALGVGDGCCCMFLLQQYYFAFLRGLCPNIYIYQAERVK